MKELTIKIFGYSYSQLKMLVSKHIFTKDISFKIKEQDLDCCLSITNISAGEKEFDIIVRDLLIEIGDNIYREGNETLAETLFHCLSMNRLKISIAESLTGGLLTNELVSIAGSSAVLNEGIVTYSNQSKISRLKVPKKIIDEYGAVSSECAVAMAEGLLKSSESDIAVSTTGLAGPSGGSEAKPVGLTYISVADNNNTKVYNHVFVGSRESIRKQAVSTALFYTIKKIMKG